MRSLVMLFFAAATFFLGSIVQGLSGQAYIPGLSIVDFVTVVLPIVFLIAAFYFYGKNRMP